MKSLKSRALDFGERLTYSMGLLMLFGMLKYLHKTEVALFHKVDLALGTVLEMIMQTCFSENIHLKDVREMKFLLGPLSQ